MKIIGIDPSLTATGFCDAYGSTFTHRPVGGDNRLLSLYREAAYQAADSADLAVIEDLPYNAKSAGVTGMAQGVIRLALMHAEVPYVSVPPGTLKKFATGRGNATKPDMRVELLRRFDLDLRDDNQVDAFWLRAIGLARYDALKLPKLPKTHLDALDRIDWTGAPEAVAA